MRILTVLLLTVYSFFATTAQAQENPKLLAHRIGTILQDNPSPTGKDAFDAYSMISNILENHPRSLEAKQIQRGKLGRTKLDLVALEEQAAKWSPDTATTIVALALSEPKEEPEAVADRTTKPSSSPPKPKKIDPSVFDSFLKPPPDDKSDSNGYPIKKTQSQVFQEMRKASVLIYFIGDGKSGGVVPVHVGTGFFISPTLILTNAHVVEAYEGYRGAWLAINESIGVREINIKVNARKDTPIKIDAAVAEVRGFQSPHHLRLNRKFFTDEWIAISGYPGLAAQFDQRYEFMEQAIKNGVPPQKSDIPTAVVDEGRINNIIIQSSSRATDLQYTMQTAGGNSGSPIVNSCGEVVGLHYSGSISRVRNDNSGSYVSSAKYNMAVSMKDVALFLIQTDTDVNFTDNECQVGY